MTWCIGRLEAILLLVVGAFAFIGLGTASLWLRRKLGISEED